MRSIPVICLAIIGASLISAAPAIAQQKTVKACQEEWRANKAANQAKGITEKAYVAQCRGGGTAAQPAQQTPTAAAPATPKTTSAAQQKTVKACRDEWRANKAANQAKGITEKAYVAQCRAGESAAQPAQQTTTPPTAAPRTTTAPAPAPPVAPTTRSTAQPAPAPAATTPTGANQYSTEAQAKARCGSGLVVWANLDSKIYHFAGYKSYGNTKSGAYMCETDATRDGMRAAKSEKRP